MTWPSTHFPKLDSQYHPQILPFFPFPLPINQYFLLICPTKHLLYPFPPLHPYNHWPSWPSSPPKCALAIGCISLPTKAWELSTHHRSRKSGGESWAEGISTGKHLIWGSRYCEVGRQRRRRKLCRLRGSDQGDTTGVRTQSRRAWGHSCAYSQGALTLVQYFHHSENLFFCNSNL